MTSWDKSKKFSETKRPSYLSLTRNTTIRTRNVRTMYQSGYTAQVAAEIHSLDGNNPDRNDLHAEICCCTQDMPLHQSHGPNILSAAFRTTKKKIKLNITECYALTNDNDEIDQTHTTITSVKYLQSP